MYVEPGHADLPRPRSPVSETRSLGSQAGSDDSLSKLDQLAHTGVSGGGGRGTAAVSPRRSQRKLSVEARTASVSSDGKPQSSSDGGDLPSLPGSDITTNTPATSSFEEFAPENTPRWPTAVEATDSRVQSMLDGQLQGINETS